MSFRKRNVGLSGGPGPGSPNTPSTPSHRETPAGVRPSPLDGRLTTSTGTQSLDNLLAGHAGLALGCSLLLEETGTTDYTGALLRYYAAEGVVQKHAVHVVGVGEQWGRELPGVVVGGKEDGEGGKVKGDKEKMKIAWRYERLGEHGAGGVGSRAPPPPDRTPPPSTLGSPQPQPFRHTYDLTTRLPLPSPTSLTYHPLSPAPSTSPFTQILTSLTHSLSTSPPTSIHRLLIPSLLSPFLYPPHASYPTHILQFLHSLRALLRRYSTRLSAMLSLPLTLYPRSSGLVRWMEILSDGVIELVPFPHRVDTGPGLTAGAKEEEKPLGMVRVHVLPVVGERGGAGGGDDLAFTVSRRRFVIGLFSLPPVEGDGEAQRGEGEEAKKGKVDIEF
ncbi:hypothetical protein MMC30_009084 [Trapelia coarctata]|nr:hypothetical protein [Trapelia coarctata]